jgi:hypothetical protein
MSAMSSPVKKSPEPRGGKKYFTLGEARRALPLVQRVALDLQAAYRQRLRLHEQMNVPGGRPMRELEALAAQFEEVTERMALLFRELNHIGVQLKDASLALLDFPAKFEGREILLCWKGGEETITHWHEVYGGFEGRKSVALLGDN